MKIAVVIFTENPKSFLVNVCYTHIVNATTILFDLFIVDMEGRSIVDCRNEFIKNCEQEYICIVPEHYIVNQNWLEDLVNAYKKDAKAGILSIRKGDEYCVISSIAVDDYSTEQVLENVFKTKTNLVEGILFFEKDKAKIDLDNYSTIFVKNHEDIALSMKLSLNGYANYYIRKQTAISLKKDEERTGEQIIEFKKAVNEFTKININ